jgi:hypothetical protein
MKKFFFLLALLALSGCVTQQRCERKFPPEIVRTDSVITKTQTIYRDTTIFVTLTPDTVFDTVHVFVRDGIANSRASIHETNLAWSKAQVVDGVLIHELRMKDSVLAFMIENAIRVSATLTEKTSGETRIVKENYVTGWQWAQIYFARIVALILGLFLVFLVIKYTIKLPSRG